jgi:hypothetical protein
MLAKIRGGAADGYGIAVSALRRKGWRLNAKEQPEEALAALSQELGTAHAVRAKTMAVDLSVPGEKIDLGEVEAKIPGVRLLALATALEKPAIGKDRLARAYDRMTGAGHAAVVAVERKLLARRRGAAPFQPNAP